MTQAPVPPSAPGNFTANAATTSTDRSRLVCVDDQCRHRQLRGAALHRCGLHELHDDRVAHRTRRTPIRDCRRTRRTGIRSAPSTSWARSDRSRPSRPPPLRHPSRRQHRRMSSATPVSGGAITVTWTASSSSVGIANYVVQRCQGTGCSNFVTVASPLGTSFADSGLTTGVSYSYRVQAVDTAGATSPFSAIATATPVSGLAAAYGFNEDSGMVDERRLRERQHRRAGQHLVDGAGQVRKRRLARRVHQLSSTCTRRPR